MNQDETLKDSVKTVEDAYRVSRKANQILAETKKTLDKSTKKIYGLTIDAFNLTGELMIKVFKEVLGKDVIMDRDNKTYREVMTIMEQQMPEKEKIKCADYVIYNNTDLQDLEEQTQEVILNIK